MRVLVFGPFFPPAFRGGGPIKTLAALLTTLPIDSEAAVVTRGSDLGESIPLEVAHDQWVTFGESKVRYMSSQSIASWFRTIEAIKEFQPDVVYVNSFFDAQFAILPRVLHRLGIFGRARMVIAPRGEFGSGALSLKARKKLAYIRTFRALLLNKGVLWHASSPRECGDIRAVMGPGAAVVVREDETALPRVADLPSPRASGHLRAVHLGRMVPIKGLLLLLEALRHVSTSLSLDVFGPVEDVDYAESCWRAVSELPEHITVTFAGPVDAALVRSVLAEYDVMMLPTAGENFGHVIAEALSVACPVMCPDTTLWTPWLRRGGGVVVEANTPDAWAQAVEYYASLPPDEIERRRAVSASIFGEWSTAASSTEHLFTMIG